MPFDPTNVDRFGFFGLRIEPLALKIGIQQTRDRGSGFERTLFSQRIATFIDGASKLLGLATRLLWRPRPMLTDCDPSLLSLGVAVLIAVGFDARAENEQTEPRQTAVPKIVSLAACIGLCGVDSSLGDFRHRYASL